MKKLPEEELELPLSFEKFIAAYLTNCNIDDEMSGYFVYLKENEYQHKYGPYEDRHQWLQAELTAYLSK